MDRETKIKLYGLAIMAAIYPAAWLIGFIIDWWHVIPSWLLEMVGLILGFTIFGLSALAAYSEDGLFKYIGIGVSILCIVLFFYTQDFSGSESCYSFRGSCI
jgi:hypothetical protein|tara:strand:+ start:1595 stop:1900 length:306 start_codon:yes stop_codon:yes gene_type:complete